MKRFFFSLIALAAAAASCTQSALLETPDQFGTEITFSPYTGRTPVTKAQSIEGAGGQQGLYGLAEAGGFQVYCFLDKKDGSPLVTYIDDANVTSTNGTTWAYDKLVYWPDASSSQSTLSFVAYSSNAVNYLNPKNSTGFTFNVPSDIDQQVDLLATAYQEDLKLGKTGVASDGKVILNFYHLLSRVGFKVQTTTNKDVTINALSLSGKMATSGSLSFTSAKGAAIPSIVTSSTKENNVTYSYLTGTETDPATTEVISGANTTAKRIVRNITNAQNQTVASEYMMIMPQTVAAQGDVTINITYTIGTSPKSKSAKVELPAGFVFAPGKAYEFILNISTSSIKFTVTEDDWDNPTEDDKSYPLIPEDENKVSAVAKVHSATTADIILTAKEAGLGKIGVEYKVKDDTDWTKINAQDYTANTPKTFNLTGLLSNTEYQFRPYSESGEVKTYYSEGSFITKTSVSVAINISGGVIDIQPYQATVYGECTNEGITERGFCLIQGSGTPTTNNRKIVVESGAEFKATFDGLTPAEQYTCCAYVIINGVTSYSDPANGQFWTAPVITVDPDTGGDNTGGDSTGGSDQKPDGPPVDSWEDGDEIPF